MPTALYDKVYSVPLAYKRPKPKLSELAEEFEFSEFGRSSGIPAGWYLAPALLIIAVVSSFLLG
jgi:hypothetical protein